MSCAKFQGDRFIIDGEIDEKHALRIIVSKTLVNIDLTSFVFWA